MEIRKILNEESKAGKGKRIRNRKKMIKRWKFEQKEGIGNVKTEKQKQNKYKSILKIIDNNSKN